MPSEVMTTKNWPSVDTVTYIVFTGRNIARADLDADMAYTQPVIIDSKPDVAARAELDADMAYIQPVVLG